MDNENEKTINISSLQNRKNDLKNSLEKAVATRNEMDGKMQSRYDTQKEEWARQCELLEKLIYDTTDLIEMIKQYSRLKVNETIIPGSIIKVTIQGEFNEFILFERQGGIKIDENLVSLSTNSPIGSAILGKGKGEKFILKINQNNLEIEIVDIYSYTIT